MMLRELLHNATERLREVTDSPRLEAEILAAHVLGETRAFLFSSPTLPVSSEVMADFNACLQRRLLKEPIAYITGKREFWTLTLNVSPATLIPRPETETLVEIVLDYFPDENGAVRLLDLGTGSGAIALAMAQERPLWRVDATDISEDALLIARKNAQQLGLNRISFWASNWFTAFPPADFIAEQGVGSDESAGKGYDVIVSNPPYIAETEWEDYAAGLGFEPRDALLSGTDGLDAIKIITSGAREFLKPGGYLLIEHGFRQAPAVRCLFNATGLVEVVTRRDLAGCERVTIGRLPA